MASWAAMKLVANAGAIASASAATAVAGLASTGLFYAGKKAIAIETRHSEAAKCGASSLSFAPQFDGLNIFETVVSKTYV